MILADTCIWIKFLKKREPVFSSMRDLLENGQIISTDWIFGELLQGARDEKERKVILEYSACIKKTDFPEIWTQAGIYSSEHKLVARGIGLIDTAILLAAKKENARFWTMDKRLLSELSEKEVYQP